MNDEIKTPDVVGYKLDEAIEAVRAAGLEPVKEVTAPPKKLGKLPLGSDRVVRVKIINDNKVELLVSSQEEY